MTAPPPGMNMAGMGTIPPPPGVTPNLVNPPHNSAPMILTAILLPIAVLFVIMRVFTRIVLLRGFGWDDATCVVGTLFSIIFATTYFVLQANGLGTDLWNIPYGSFNLLLWARWNYAQDLLYTLITALIKISICLLYFKLFTISSWTRYAIYGTVTFVALYSAIGILIIIFACRPLNTLWDLLETGTCLNTADTATALASLNIVADVFILSIPVPVVLGLQLPLKQKLGVLSIFSAGIFVTIASCIRLYLLIQDLNDPAKTINATMSTLDFGIWSIAEMYLSITLSCMATFKPFLYKIRPWYHEQRSSKRSQYSKTSGGSGSNGQRAPGYIKKQSSSSAGSKTIMVNNSFDIEMEKGTASPAVHSVDMPGRPQGFGASWHTLDEIDAGRAH